MHDGARAALWLGHCQSLPREVQHEAKRRVVSLWASPPPPRLARRARPSPGARHSASLPASRSLPPCCLARTKAWNAPTRLDRLRAALDRTAAQKHATPVSTFPRGPSNHRSFSQVQQPRLLPGAASRRGRAFSSSPPRGTTSSARHPSGYPRSIFSQANGGGRRALWASAPLWALI